MATLKKEVIDLASVLPIRFMEYRVKLDAWRVTIAMGSRSAGPELLMIDGANVSAMLVTTAGIDSSPFVVTLGGAVVNGRPVLLDDVLTFRTLANWVAGETAGFIIKEFFVEDRPGPDRTLADEARPAAREAKRPGTSTTSPRRVIKPLSRR